MDNTTNQVRYCFKCGAIIADGHFCDFYCKKEYYAEIRRNDEEIYKHLFMEDR